MQHFIDFSELDRERFFRTAAASLEVKHRNQFFLWATGELQAVFPHQVLVCASQDRAGELTMLERISVEPARRGEFEDMTQPRVGLIARLIAAWLENGARPRLVSAGANGSGCADFAPDLARFRLQNAISHGVVDSHGKVAVHVSFMSVPEPLTARQHAVLELVTPHIYAALARANAADIRPSSVRADTHSGVTGRELEILQGVQQGKSNAEIGEELKISPLTVKNHVRKILRKLNVHNRAAAVSRAIGERLITP